MFGEQKGGRTRRGRGRGRGEDEERTRRKRRGRETRKGRRTKRKEKDGKEKDEAGKEEEKVGERGEAELMGGWGTRAQECKEDGGGNDKKERVQEADKKERHVEERG